MKDNSDKYSIERMAEVFGVSRSGYYAWLKRPESKRKKYNRLLLEQIREVHRKSRGIFGSPKIREALIRKGYKCSLKLVARLMRENGIRSITFKKYRGSSSKKSGDNVSDNILNREFDVSEPDKVWVSDITYIYTGEGWFYLCVIIDLFSREVVGWSGSRYIDTELVLKALEAACTKRKPGKGILFHSDRGSQYTSNKLKKKLIDLGFISSMSRKGNCWDNAVAESFFRSLKVEEVYQRRYKTREEARLSIFSYIEIFYNRERLHASLGYLTPAEVEAG